MEEKKLQERDVPSDLKLVVPLPFPGFSLSAFVLHPFPPPNQSVSLSLSLVHSLAFSTAFSPQYSRPPVLVGGSEISGHGKVQRVETKGSTALEILEQWRPNNGQLLEIQLTMKSALFERTTFQPARFIESSSVPLVKLIISKLTDAFSGCN